jgi:hypothetical protein
MCAKFVPCARERLLFGAIKMHFIFVREPWSHPSEEEITRFSTIFEWQHSIILVSRWHQAGWSKKTACLQIEDIFINPIVLRLPGVNCRRKKDASNYCRAMTREPACE